MSFPSQIETQHESDHRLGVGLSLQISVQLFAAAADKAGCRQLQLTLPPAANLAELRRRLAANYPNLEHLSNLSRWAVDCEFVADDFVFLHDRTIAMIPPVSGG